MRTILALLCLCVSLNAQYIRATFTDGPPGTPIDSNSGGGCSGSSGAWTCTGAATVTLTDAGSLALYYTVDGSTPSCPATGTLYTTPFTSPGTTFTLKAIGCNGVTGGGVLTSVYTITGGGTVSFVKKAPGSNCFGGTSCATAYGSNVTANNILVACTEWAVASPGSTSSVTGFTDTQGNTWTIPSGVAQVRAGAGAGRYSFVGTSCARAKAGSSAADTVTATYSSSTAVNVVNVYEFSTTGSLGTVDQASGSNAASGAPSAGTVTAGSANQCSVANTLTDDGSGIPSNFTANTGWTINSNDGGGSGAWADEYICQAGTGFTGSFSASGTGPWAASIVTIKP